MIDRQLTAAAAHFMRWNLERIERCVGELTEEEFWGRPNAHSNSVGNQLMHLEGNIRQWILSGLGGQPDTRNRPAEFADAPNRSPKETVLQRLRDTVHEAVAVVEKQRAADLLPERAVQAYVHDGTHILLHVVEHMSYHTGQVIFWTKQLWNRELAFYAGDDLNQTN